MKTNTKFIVFFILLSVVCISVFGISSLPHSKPDGTVNSIVQNTSSNTTIAVPLARIVRISGPVSINTTVSNYSSTIPVYHGVMGENDSVDLRLKPTVQIRLNVTSAKDAPEVVKRLLIPYGGLPADAEITGAGTSYAEYFHNGTLVAKKPTITTVTYARLINGMWIIGDSNRILVDIGEDELLWYLKTWRNYTYTGDVPVISPEKAIDKLEREELIESSIHPEDFNASIDMIALGYYAKKTGGNDTILEPIWMFYGKSAARPRFGLYVYARQFANFTATPVTAAPADEIAFRSTSDGSPTRQFWDFGDGSNTTLRNPVHSYLKSGTYNVTLTAWNELGSDTLTKIHYITIVSDNLKRK